MASDADALWFHVSDAALQAAIDLLRPLKLLVTHNEAWQMLITENSRRELRSPASQVQLTQEAFDALPADVRALLDRI
jgi:predicted O-methyltransferase YrrM